MYLDITVNARLQDRTLRRALSRALLLATDDGDPLRAMTSSYGVGHLGGQRTDTVIECTHRLAPAGPVAVHIQSPLLDAPAQRLSLQVRALWVPLHTRVEGLVVVDLSRERPASRLTGTLRGYSCTGVCPECSARVIESALARMLHEYAAGAAGRWVASRRAPGAAAIRSALSGSEGARR